MATHRVVGSGGARRRRVGNGFRLGFVDSLSRVVERSRSSGASVRVDKLGVLAASRALRARIQRRRLSYICRVVWEKRVAARAVQGGARTSRRRHVAAEPLAPPSLPPSLPRFILRSTRETKGGRQGGRELKFGLGGDYPQDLDFEEIKGFQSRGMP